MKIPDRSHSSDLLDMQPLEIEHFLVMLQRFKVWNFFGQFFGTEMYAIDNYHFRDSFGKIQLYLPM